LFKLFAFWFWFGVWTFGLGLIFVGALRWWSGDHWLLVRLCNYLMPWLFVVLLVGVGLSLLTNRHLLSLLLVLPSLFLLLTYAPLFMPRPDRSNGGFQVKVMSYNVWRENSNISGIAEVIRKQKPDLILLQEIHRHKLMALISELDALYLGESFVVFEERMHQAIISHFPLEAVAVGPDKGEAQKAIVSTPEGEITVLNVHPPRGRWQRRHEQMIALISDDIAVARNPLILGGDFNTTDQSQTFQLFGPILKNSHWQAGWGFGFTYPTSAVNFFGKFTLPPLVRIDHIFHSKHFITQEASTLTSSGGSDHFPIIAVLTLKSEKPSLGN
jgi:endonuclease/exonuclease/phosphatase (EEP) superfamily protein YafD